MVLADMLQVGVGQRVGSRGYSGRAILTPKIINFGGGFGTIEPNVYSIWQKIKQHPA
jgi:hypothetical protein